MELLQDGLRDLPVTQQVALLADLQGDVQEQAADAAAQLPPASNLRRFVAEGADLVAFSGGKAIGGPQSTGILCGRRDLVAAAGLQHLDQDLLPDDIDSCDHFSNRVFHLYTCVHLDEIKFAVLI